MSSCPSTPATRQNSEIGIENTPIRSNKSVIARSGSPRTLDFGNLEEVDKPNVQPPTNVQTANVETKTQMNSFDTLALVGGAQYYRMLVRDMIGAGNRKHVQVICTVGNKKRPVLQDVKVEEFIKAYAAGNSISYFDIFGEKEYVFWMMHKFSFDNCKKMYIIRRMHAKVSGIDMYYFIATEKQ